MIRLNGVEAMLQSKQGCKYNLTNPHLLYDSIPSTTAEIPTFPAVAQNRGIFDYYEEPQAGNYLPELVYQHFENGDLIQEGYFLLTEASAETGYKGVYSDKLGLFFGDYQSKSLREIDFGSVTIPSLFPATGEVLENGEKHYCFPTVRNESYYGTNATNYSGCINLFNPAESIILLNGETPLVPCFFVSWVIQRIATITGVTISGPFLEDPVWSNLILFNLKEAENINVSIAEHLPSMTVVEFLMELRKVANLQFSFNSVERKLEINFWENALKTPTQENWSTKATTGETKTPETNTRIKLSMQLDPNDAMAKDKPSFFSDYISPQTSGNRNGIAEINMKFSSLSEEGYLVPVCKQEGQTSLFGQDTKPFSPRLLFWIGMENDLALSSNSLAGITLSPSGLADTAWKETIALRERMFYLKKDFLLTEADIAKIDFSKKYHCQGVDYLLAMVNVQVPISGVAECLLVGGV